MLCFLLRIDWDIKPELPRIPGHEGIGEIIELGSMVGNHLKKGDIIGVPWLHSTCLHCEYCLTGRETLCKEQINSGYSCDGCFAEYALMDANFAVKLPEGMDPYKSAPLYCAGVTVYKALKVSQVKPGEWVSIVGVGGLGKYQKKKNHNKKKFISNFQDQLLFDMLLQWECVLLLLLHQMIK
jgi:propanol-preferring alcohol dehydrogenase